MRLKTKFILFVVLLNGTTLVLTYFIFREQPLLFILSEVVILLSILLSWSLYGQMLRPLKLLLQGIEAIKDKDFNVKFRPTGKTEMDQLVAVYNRMIDELRSERTLQEEQHFFLEKLIQTSPTGIIILDYDHEVQQINPKAMQILGMGQTPRDDRQPHGRLELPEAFLHQIVALPSGGSRTIRLGGVHTYKLQKSHFIDRGFQRHFIMLEELTTELLAAEKNVYGKVIRMMAHEVNNTIGPVNSIIQSFLSSPGLHEGSYREAFGAAHDRNHNLNLFVRNFADLVKLPEPTKKPMDLHPSLRSVASVMGMMASERGVDIILELPPTPFLIFGDEQQLEQALINIVKNAIEAIEGPGTVWIITDPGAQTLVIADTGKGIQLPEHSEQLFSPFFSTKKDGQGIGLTLVREILVQHVFEFTLQTTAKGRTEFTILFTKEPYAIPIR